MREYIELFKKWPGLPPCDPVKIFDIFLRDGYDIWGAYINDILVGMVMLGPADESDDRLLANLIVDDNHRKKGIATSLINTVRESSTLEANRLVFTAEDHLVDWYMKMGARRLLGYGNRFYF